MNLKFWKSGEVLNAGQRRIRKRERLLLILSGILLGISFPPFPFPFQLCMFCGLIPYIYVIQKKITILQICRSSYLAFFVFSLITLYWVGSWQKNADPFLMISGILLLFVNPVILLIPAAILYFSRRLLSPNITLFLFPFFWISYEYAYMVTDLSFPWLTLGSGLSHFTAFIQIADIIGALGLSFSVVLINVLLYKFIINFRLNKNLSFSYLAVAVFIFAFFIVYGLNKLNNFQLSSKKIKVGLIQPDIDPWKKWDTGNLEEFTKLYLNFSRKAVHDGAKLIVWPETAIPVYLLSGGYNETLDSIYNFLTENNVHLLTGMPDIIYYGKDDKKPDDVKYSPSLGYYATYNAIILFSPRSREVQRYGKMKLVPYGERVPFVDQLPFLGDIIKWGVGISGWNVGKDTTVFKIAENKNRNKADTIKIDGLVCYESIYPVFVSEFIRRGAEFISIVTNDSWYGNSSGPYQHKEISVLRAVENRRTVIRAANGGISCIINPLGITMLQSKMFTKTVLVGDVYLQDDETFFTKNAYLLPIVSSILSVWIIGIFLLFKLKDKFKL